MKRLLFLLPFLLALFIIGCGGDDRREDTTVRESPNISMTPRQIVIVSIEDSLFNPPQITIEPGMTVRWTNNTANEQSVISGTEPQIVLNSGPIRPGDSFEFTFNSSDNYEYYGSSNPNTQRGIVVVREDAERR
jgi:plastocyanin